MNNQHPQVHNIVGLSKENLLNRKSVVEYALYNWHKELNRKNREYNINYFTEELELINNELRKSLIN